MAKTKYNLEYDVDLHGVRQLDACDALYQIMPFISVKDANQTLSLLLSTPRLYRISLGDSTTIINFEEAASYYPNRVSITRLILYATIRSDQTVEFKENGTILPSTVFVNSDKITTIPAGKLLIVDCLRIPWENDIHFIMLECKRRGWV